MAPTTPRSLKRASLNAFWITLSSLAQRLAPFIVIPILSRRLGTDSFGSYVAAIALSAIVSQVVEFGFNLTATKKVASIGRASADKLGEVLADVILGRLLIVTTILVVLAIARQFGPIVIANPWLFWSSVALGVVIGSDFRFVFYGTQRIGYVVSYAVGYVVFSTTAILLWVHGPQTLWRAFALPAVIALGFLGVSGFLLRSPFSALRFSWRKALAALRESSSAFLQRGLIQANSNFSPLILAALIPPAGVGFFGLAERLLRQAALFGINPAQSTFIPHVAALAPERPRLAARDFLYVCGALAVASLLGGVVVLLTAPLLAWIFLGSGHEAAIPAFRILAFSPFLIVLTQFGGALWLFLIGRQRANNIITLTYCAVSIAMLAAGGFLYGYVGACYAVVIAQMLLVLVYLVYFAKTGIAPWSAPLGVAFKQSATGGNGIAGDSER